MSVVQQIHAIEKAALWSWPPERTSSINDWLLRSSSDISNRTNSASILALSVYADPAKTIAEVENWYRDQGKAPCFQLIAAELSKGVDGLLADRGYQLITPSTVMLRPAQSSVADETIDLLTRPTATIMNVLSDPGWSPETSMNRAALFRRIHKPHVFAVRTVDGEPISGGLCVVDADIAGIFAMRTVNTQRGRGHAKAILARLLDWSARMGAQKHYLQVERDNEPAIALYRSEGFEDAYHYWYRKRD